MDMERITVLAEDKRKDHGSGGTHRTGLPFESTWHGCAPAHHQPWQAYRRSITEHYRHLRTTAPHGHSQTVTAIARAKAKQRRRDRWHLLALLGGDR